MEFFLNGAELSLNSVKFSESDKLYWAQFKDPVSHMCLAGTKRKRSQVRVLLMTNIFVTEFNENTFRKNSNIS